MMSMSDNTKHPLVAVLGAGYWGKNLIRNLDAVAALEIICDSDPGALEEMKKLYPMSQTLSSADEAIKSDHIDAVVISTPASSHYKLVRQCLNAGKHVFVEKPLCLEVEQGEELVCLAKKNNLILMVGHLLQFHPAVQKLKKFVADGELGKIQYISSNRLNMGKIRKVENILWSFAPHDISIILSLAGQMPHRVTSFGSHFLQKNVADVTLSVLQFPSGLDAHIFVSWLHPFKEQKLVVVGDKKMAVFDDIEQEDKLLLYPYTIKWSEGLPIPDKKSAERIPFERKEPLREEMLSFLESVSSNKQPITNGEEGIKVLKVLSSCQASLEKGGASIELDKIENAPVKTNGIKVHSSSIIDENCRIGEGTKIWHFTHVMSGSVIGRNCRIGQNVVIGPNVALGDGCKIQGNVSVVEGVTLEDHVFCGPSMVFTNVTNPRAAISRKNEFKPTLIKTGASIGANATIICGVTLGNYCFIGAGAVVKEDVPDYAFMAGVPAIKKGWMCACGEKLMLKIEHCICGECGAEYRIANESLERIV